MFEDHAARGKNCLFTARERNTFNEKAVKPDVNEQRRNRHDDGSRHDVVPEADVPPFERVQSDRQRKHGFIGHHHERL
jgi:hypothetical protein